MKRPLTVEEIREMPEPKEIQDLMVEIVGVFRLAERQAAGNIALAYWRGRQEAVKRNTAADPEQGME